MNKTLLIVLSILGVITLGLLVIGLSVAGSYNGMVSSSQAVDSSWAQVQNVYQRRSDLIPNLVQTVQGAANFEGQLGSALSRLLVVAENYPDLKATANFRDLQAQLEGTENRISVERGRFNTTVQIYNTKIRTFPTVFFAGLFGFQQKPYFQASAGAETAPAVKFDFGTPAAK